MTQYIRQRIVQLTNEASEALSAGQPQVALERITEAHNFWKRLFTNDLKLSAGVCHVYGNVMESLGQYEQARESYKRTLEINLQIYGTKPHPDVAISLHDLGNVMCHLGQYEQARDFYQKDLEIEQQIYGHKPHPSIATTLNALGNVMDSLGQHKQALKFVEQGLKMSRQVHGQNAHPDVARSLFTLGNVMQRQGRYEQAFEFYQQSLEMERQIYGHEPHPSVVSSLFALGNVLQRQGRYEQAFESYQQVLEINRQLYGTRPHPQVASSLCMLSNLTNSLGRHHHALELIELGHEMNRQIYGDEAHPSVAFSLQTLGVVMHSLGRYNQAFDYVQQALEIRQRIYGNEAHPDVSSSLYELGNLLYCLARYNEAFSYYQQALEMWRQIYSDDAHPNVALVLHALGNIMYHSGQYEQASDYLQQALKIDEQVYSVEHMLPRDERITFLADIARTRLRLEQYQQGLEQLCAALELHLTRQHLLSGTLRAKDVRRNHTDKILALSELLRYTPMHPPVRPRVATLWFNFKGSAGALDTAMHLLVERNRDLEPLYKALKEATRRLVQLQDVVPTTPEQTSAHQQQVLEAQQQRQDAEERLRREAREVFELQDLKLEQVAATLQPGETYLDYALLGNEAFAFTLRQASGQPEVKLFSLGSVQVLDEQVKLLRASIEPKDHQSVLNPLLLESFGKAEEPAAQLYDALIRPLGLSAASPLLVSPDGELNFVPFDLLYNAETGRFLGQDHEVSSVTNARDLVRLHRAESREPEGSVTEGSEAGGQC